jgi:hypothetical protein
MLKNPKIANSFSSNFSGITSCIIVTPLEDGFNVSIDGKENVWYPNPSIADAVINMNEDIVQPIQLSNQNVKIQFEGTVFDIDIMPQKGFEAEKLMPEKPKEVRN